MLVFVYLSVYICIDNAIYMCVCVCVCVCTCVRVYVLRTEDHLDSLYTILLHKHNIDITFSGNHNGTDDCSAAV